MYFCDVQYCPQKLWHLLLRCTDKFASLEATIQQINKTNYLIFKIHEKEQYSEQKGSSIYKEFISVPLEGTNPQSVTFSRFFKENFDGAGIKILKGKQLYPHFNEPNIDDKKKQKIQNARYYYIFKQNLSGVIGRGRHGKVYKGFRLNIKMSRFDENPIKLALSRQQCAIKHFNYSCQINDEILRMKIQEASQKEQLVTRLINKTCEQRRLDQGISIIKILDNVSLTQQSYNIYELCKCDLREFIKNDYPLTSKHIFQIMLQLVSVLRLAQSKLFRYSPQRQHFLLVHRDLKLKNILVSDYSSFHIRIKVTDWELAKIMVKGGKQKLQKEGTPEYLAPEVKIGAYCDQKTDIWALGAIIYELILSKQFQDYENHELQLSDYQFFDKTALNNDQIKFSRTLLIKLLQKDSVNRWQLNLLQTHFIQYYKPIKFIEKEGRQLQYVKGFVLDALDDKMMACLHSSSRSIAAKTRLAIYKQCSKYCILTVGHFHTYLLKDKFSVVCMSSPITFIDSFYHSRILNLQIFEQYRELFDIGYSQILKESKKKNIKTPRYMLNYCNIEF